MDCIVMKRSVDVEQIEMLISKYIKVKKQQEDFIKKTPLTNVVQHQLLDQNIHIFNEIIDDLNNLIL